MSLRCLRCLRLLSAFTSFTSTWASWTLVTENIGPAPRSVHAAAWDSRRSTFWVHGGSGETMHKDLWSFDIASGSWNETLVASPSSPAAREDHAAAWDPVREEFWIYGGYDGNDFQRDLWKYSPITSSWRREWDSFASGPSARSDHVAVWDDTRLALWIHGGMDSIVKGDLWRYDSRTKIWTPIQHQDPPSARAYHVAVWDTENWVIWLHGGHDGRLCGDLWMFDTLSPNQQWARVWEFVDDGPTPRAYHAAAWDPVDRALWIHGGLDGIPRRDLWRFDTETVTWELLIDNSGPSRRYNHVAGYDVPSRSFWIHSGYEGSTLQDLWRFDFTTTTTTMTSSSSTVTLSSTTSLSSSTTASLTTTTSITSTSTTSRSISSTSSSSTRSLTSSTSSSTLSTTSTFTSTSITTSTSSTSSTVSSSSSSVTSTLTTSTSSSITTSSSSTSTRSSSSTSSLSSTTSSTLSSSTTMTSSSSSATTSSSTATTSTTNSSTGTTMTSTSFTWTSSSSTSSTHTRTSSTSSTATATTSTQTLTTSTSSTVTTTTTTVEDLTAVLIICPLLGLITLVLAAVSAWWMYKHCRLRRYLIVPVNTVPATMTVAPPPSQSPPCPCTNQQRLIPPPGPAKSRPKPAHPKLQLLLPDLRVALNIEVSILIRDCRPEPMAWQASLPPATPAPSRTPFQEPPCESFHSSFRLESFERLRRRALPEHIEVLSLVTPATGHAAPRLMLPLQPLMQPVPNGHIAQVRHSKQPVQANLPDLRTCTQPRVQAPENRGSSVIYWPSFPRGPCTPSPSLRITLQALERCDTRPPQTPKPTGPTVSLDFPAAPAAAPAAPPAIAAVPGATAGVPVLPWVEPLPRHEPRRPSEVVKICLVPLAPQPMERCMARLRAPLLERHLEGARAEVAVPHELGPVLPELTLASAWPMTRRPRQPFPTPPAPSLEIAITALPALAPLAPLAPLPAPVPRPKPKPGRRVPSHQASTASSRSSRERRLR